MNFEKRYVTLGEHVLKLMNEQGPECDDFKELVKVWGLETLRKAYALAKEKRLKKLEKIKEENRDWTEVSAKDETSDG